MRINELVGTLYLIEGLVSLFLILFRSILNWSHYTLPQRFAMFSFNMFACSFIDRGYQLDFTHNPSPLTSASVFGMLAGAAMMFFSLHPTDPRVTRPDEQPMSAEICESCPLIKYMDILNRSAEVRKTKTPNSDLYETKYNGRLEAQQPD